jgi:hypothetical protein
MTAPIVSRDVPGLEIVVFDLDHYGPMYSQGDAWFKWRWESTDAGSMPCVYAAGTLWERVNHD